MTIAFEILGLPGRDNALFVHVDSGQSMSRLLFDCGDGCLNSVPYSEVLGIDHLFLSHLHMDHIGGFDYFFRCLFNRRNKENHIWGPAGTASILHHRFQGFLWNLHAEMEGTWRVHELTQGKVTTSRFELREAFTYKHEEGSRDFDSIVVGSGDFAIEAHLMDHGTPSIAYVLREKDRTNIDNGRLSELNLRPGAWLKQIKEATPGQDEILIDGCVYSKNALRHLLVTATPGDSIAYLTDFLLDDIAIDYLTEVLERCITVVCEAQYRNIDHELASRHFHMTTGAVAKLARRAQIGRLFLFHLSDRYTSAEWLSMLEEAREVFPDTFFPENWQFQSKQHNAIN